jgi:type IV pilus assembly protein PilA
MKLSTRRQGFTLVEIMIVVVIIGLLAAMAIPAFQKVRRASIKSTMANDGRQLSSGANQYFLENSVTIVNVSELAGGTGRDTKYVKELSKGVTLAAGTTTLQQDGTFALVHPNFGTLTISVDTGKTTAENLQ